MVAVRRVATATERVATATVLVMLVPCAAGPCARLGGDALQLEGGGGDGRKMVGISIL